MSENLYDELRKKSPGVTGGLIRMREETFKDGVVPAKYKILSALAIVTVTKCEPCIRAYTRMAYETGINEDELVEFLNVAITEGGCPAEQWAMKAYGVYKELMQGKRVEEEVCCTVDSDR
ncbi:MAG: carboxymuconolactone decarboxylase family protein [Spirochaetes bacterium]|nr:MAG: carboxymuconolactone decarboxylase family protein [Spirochaetota bacterium]